MTRRIFLLMGLAILAVVVSHAAGWGQIAMINWADRYRPVTVPNFDQVGSLPYNLLVFIRQLLVFAVPVFLFCSGFFVAYAARGSQAVFTWKMARIRIVDLLVPYFIWSISWIVLAALQHKIYSPVDYLALLVLGTADGGSYFFVPLLCQFYLLSPVIVPLAKAKPKRVLLAAVFTQAVTFCLQYLKIFSEPIARLPFVSWVGLINYQALFFSWTIYFALGVVCGFHGMRVKQRLLRWKWHLVGLMVIAATVSMFEAEAIYWTTGHDNRFVPFTISSILYSVAFILVYVVFDKIWIPAPALIQQLGGKSYGIYLAHTLMMVYSARVIRQIVPWLLAYPVVLFAPLMLTIGLGGPLLLMTIVRKSPARRYFRLPVRLMSLGETCLRILQNLAIAT